MSPELLLKYFNRICEAPDAIPRLRTFILDLAVRGKLVEQDSNDNPASELLERIQTKKAQLLKLGKIDRQKPLPQIRDEELPFLLPRAWSWARLAAISQRIHYGFTASANASLKDVRLLRITDIQNNLVDWPSVPGCEISQREVAQYKLERGDILVARTGGTIGKTFLVSQMPVTAVFASYLIRIQKSSEFYDRYLKLFLESPVYWKQLHEGSRGGGQPNVNGQTLGKMIVAVPPIPEQHRIVAKVDELMGLCDRLEVVHTERENRRDRLAAVSLHHLNNGANSEDFRRYARFHLNHLPRLITRTEHISEFRRAIISLAVRGKIVSQDSNDVPVSELLGRIQAEKADLIGVHAQQREYRESRLSNEDIPFDLPSSWQWEPLQSVIVFGPQNGISPKPSSRPDAPRAVTLTATTKGTFDSRYFKKVDATIPQDSEFWLRPGDLLFQRGNTREYVGMAAYYSGEPGLFLYPDLMIKVRLSEKVNLRYVHLCAVAPYARTYFSTHASGAQSTMPKINQSMLVKLAIPLAPFAEQIRIVAKVDELMVLCDQLEAQLATTQIEKRSLLEAVLFHALNDSPSETDRSFAIKA